MAERRPYTRAELELADRLRKEMSLSDVAQRLDRPYSSLNSTLCRYRKGTWKGCWDEYRAVRAELERRLFERETTAGMARALGVSRVAVATRLTRMGYDGELRQEIRSGAWREAAE